MKKKITTIVQDGKINNEIISKFINDFVDYLLKRVFNSNGAGIRNIREHIKNHNQKIIPFFVELVQLHLDANDKIYDEATKEKIKVNRKLFKKGFKEIMEHTKFGFYQFIYEAWRDLLIKLRDEFSKENNKKSGICRLHYSMI